MVFRHPADEQAPISPEVEALAAQVVDAIYMIRTELGIGLLEEPYLLFLADELHARGIPARVREQLPVVRRGRIVKDAYVPDLVVDGIIVVEAKAVRELSPRHHAQIITYLKLSGRPLGYLVNFNATFLEHEIHRKLNPDRAVREEACRTYVPTRLSFGPPAGVVGSGVG